MSAREEGRTAWRWPSVGCCVARSGFQSAKRCNDARCACIQSWRTRMETSWRQHSWQAISISLLHRLVAARSLMQGSHIEPCVTVSIQEASVWIDLSYLVRSSPSSSCRVSSLVSPELFDLKLLPLFLAHVINDRILKKPSKGLRASLGLEDTMAATKNPKRKKKRLNVNNMLLGLLINCNQEE